MLISDNSRVRINYFLITPVILSGALISVSCCVDVHRSQAKKDTSLELVASVRLDIKG